MRSGDGAVSNDPPDALQAITSERDQLAAEKAELQDRYVRLQAEFQNSRKRADRDRAEFAEYASTEAVRALLPILDDFERALKTEAAGKEFAKGHGIDLPAPIRIAEETGLGAGFRRRAWPSIRTCIMPWRWWKPKTPPTIP